MKLVRLRYDCCDLLLMFRLVMAMAVSPTQDHAYTVSADHLVLKYDLHVRVHFRHVRQVVLWRF